MTEIDERAADVALSLELLPAAFGDCLVLSAPTDSGVFRMVVDTGPDVSSLAALRERLGRIPVQGGRRPVDLFVISHIDHDHIGNASALLRDDDLRLEFGDVWFNGKDEVRGTAEADEVSLAIRERGLPHNRAFGGGPAVTTGAWLEVPIGTGLPRITLLSPTPHELTRLANKWPDVVDRLNTARPDSEHAEPGRGVRPDRPPIDLVTLSEVPYQRDRSVPNASSIVLLVEHRGASILLAADGHSEVYGRGLAALLQSRGAGHTSIDAVKLAHHGSRRNTESKLALFGARHYMISSDNGIYGLPDDETIARLVAKARPGHPPTFWFNYPTMLNLRWRKVHDPRHPFTTRYPDVPGGVVLELPSVNEER